MIQYPASLLVLTANTLYKGSVSFFLNKQAKLLTFPEKERHYLINRTSKEFTHAWPNKEGKAGL